MLVMSSSSINTQFLVHFKSISISHLISGKSRDIQKLLKYFNGTTGSVFKGGRWLVFSIYIPFISWSIRSCFCKLLKYFNGTTGSVFKGGNGGWSSLSASPSFLDRSGLASVFRITFVLCLNYLPSEAFASTSSISFL